MHYFSYRLLTYLATGISWLVSLTLCLDVLLHDNHIRFIIITDLVSLLFLAPGAFWLALYASLKKMHEASPVGFEKLLDRIFLLLGVAAFVYSFCILCLLSGIAMRMLDGYPVFG